MSNLLQKASIVTTPTAYGVGVLNSIKPAFSVSDTELVTNGDFSNGLTGWSGSTLPTQNPDNSLTFDSPSENMFQSISRIVGRKYRITFDGTGSLGYRTGYASPDNVVRQVTLPAVVDIVANATTNRIQPYGPSSGTTILKSISLREITDADFDFTRTSSATRVNPDYLIETVSINSANLVQNGSFSELGSEEITNGNFETDSDWTLTQATIINGAANISTTGSLSGIVQSSVTTSGKTYKFNIEITNIQTLGDGISLTSGGLTSSILHTFTTLGTHTVYFTATSTTVGIKRKSGATDITIDNVSVKQVDPNDNWSLFNGATITDNKANIIGDGSAFGYIEQLNTFTSGKKYKITLDAVINSGGGLVVKYAIGFSANIGSITTSGSYTFSYTAGVTGSIIIGRKTSGTAYDSSITNISVIEIQENGVPRLDYTNGTASILLEPQSTNLVTYSEDFADSSWTKLGAGTASAAVVTSNYAISPDGTSNASRLQCDLNGGGGSSANQSLIYDTISGSGDTTAFIYVKSNTSSSQNFYLANSLNDFVIGIATTEWQKFKLNWVAGGAIRSLSIGTRGTSNSDDTLDLLIWGAQVEALSFATSYIPSLTGSATSRAAETLTNAGNSDLINSTEGVLYAEMAALANDGTNRAISISDGTTSNVVRFYYSATDNRIVGNVKSGGSSVFTFNNVLSNAVDFIKLAIKYKANDFKMYVNGIEVSTDTSGAAPIGLKELAFDNGAGNDEFYGKTKCVAVFKEALSDTELACLTSTNNREIFLNYYYRMQYVGANTEALSCAEQTFNV